MHPTRGLGGCAWRISAAAIVVVAALYLAISPAHAQEVSLNDRAKKLFMEGKEHYKSERFTEALHDFRAALNLVPRASAMMMVAHCYRRLHWPDQALSYYQQYLSAWAAKHPTKPPPFKTVVEGYIAHMKTIVVLVKKGEELLRQGKATSALTIFQTAFQQNRWPKIYLDEALCYRAMNKPDKALTSIKTALKYWERYLSTWQKAHPDIEAPHQEEIQKRIRRLQAIHSEISKVAAKPKTEPPAPTDPQPAEGVAVAKTPKVPPAKRSKFWLISGISTAAFVVGFEIAAWASFAKANDTFTVEPAFDDYRRMTIAGHVLAGTFAAASAVSFFLYYRSGKKVPPTKSLAIVPLRRGWSLAGAVQF